MELPWLREVSTQKSFCVTVIELCVWLILKATVWKKITVWCYYNSVVGFLITWFGQKGISLRNSYAINVLYNSVKMYLLHSCYRKGNLLKYLYLVCVCTHAHVWAWYSSHVGSGNNLWKFVLSFHHVESQGNQTPVVRLNSKLLPAERSLVAW